MTLGLQDFSFEQMYKDRVENVLSCAGPQWATLIEKGFITSQRNAKKRCFISDFLV